MFERAGVTEIYSASDEVVRHSPAGLVDPDSHPHRSRNGYLTRATCLCWAPCFRCQGSSCSATLARDGVHRRISRLHPGTRLVACDSGNPPHNGHALWSSLLL